MKYLRLRFWLINVIAKPNYKLFPFIAILLLPFPACNSPPPIPNGRFDEKLLYLEGDEIFYQCSQNYDLIGINRNVCERGKWKLIDEDLPKCQLGQKLCVLNCFLLL